MTTVVELHSKSACHGMKANIKLAFQFCGYTSPGPEVAMQPVGVAYTHGRYSKLAWHNRQLALSEATVYCVVHSLAMAAVSLFTEGVHASVSPQD